MAKAFKNTSLESHFPQHPIPETAKIRPFLSFRSSFSYDHDYPRQSKIKRIKVLSCHDTNFEHLPMKPPKAYYFPRHSHQKQVQKLHVAFCHHDTLATIINHISRYIGIKSIYVTLRGTTDLKLIKSLSKLARLKHLALTIYQKQPKADNSTLQLLDKLIARLKTVTSLHLAFKEQKTYVLQTGMVFAGSIFRKENEDIKLFFNTFSLLKRLVHLSLTILVTDYELNELGKSLQRLESLTTLFVNLGDSRSLTYKGVNDLLTGIELAPKLHTLGLGFAVFEYIGEWEETPFLHPIWQLESIAHIHLAIKLHGLFAVELVDALIQPIVKIKNLESFCFSFHRAQFVDNKRIKALATAASQLSNVTNFDLNFVVCQGIDASIANYAMHYIMDNENLEVVNLTFQSSFKKFLDHPAHDMEVMRPMKTLAKVRRLNIGFISCGELTTYQIIEMNNLLKMCINVRELVVNLSFCEVTKPADIQDLVKTISSLQKVERLTLEISGKYKGTDETFVDFSRLGFLELRYFDINMSYWTEIKDQDLEKLGKALARLKALEELKLNFLNCKRLTDSGVQNMCVYFVELKRLGALCLGWEAQKVNIAPKAIVSQLEKALLRLCYVHVFSSVVKVWNWVYH